MGVHRNFPSKTVSILVIFLLVVVGLCNAGHQKTVEIVGIGECADCLQNNIKDSHAFKGLKVTIDCKLANGEVKTRGVGELNEDGKFQVKFPKELVGNGKLKEECYAQLHSASNTPCPILNTIESSKLTFVSGSNGKHTFSPTHKLKFSPATCTSAFLWPYFKFPPLPNMPDWSHFHHFPKKSFPKITFPPFTSPFKFPPKTPCPPFFKNPFPPIIHENPPPVYDKPPPIYEKPLPPPVHEKPLPPPIYENPLSPPVYEKPMPPPTPIYKKPCPPKMPPTPIYKKPMPPPTPVYEKPLPPPVPIYEKPLPPPVPISKKPCPPKIPHIPVYIPKPLPPILPKKPCPPIPKLPPFPFPKFPPHKFPPKFLPHHKFPPEFFKHPKFKKLPSLPILPPHH